MFTSKKSTLFSRSWVDLSGGQRLRKAGFLIGLIAISNIVLAQSPGGISANLKLWLKANASVTTTPLDSVTLWADQSGGNNNASYVNPILFGNAIGSISGINHPSYVQNAFNFNPGVRFGGVSTTQFASLEGNFATPVTSTNVSAYVVAKMNNASGGSGRLFMISQSALIIDYTHPETANLMGRSGNGVNAQRNSLSTGAVGPVVALPPFLASSHYTASNQGKIELNGSAFTTTAFTTAAFNSSFFRLGQSTAFLDDFLNGDIAEVVFYTADQSSVAANHNQIESYLALKYGIHKAGNYVNSAGLMFWDSTANAAYHHDVFGIGQDNGSGLLQSKSNSVNTGNGDGTGQGAKGNIVIGNWSSFGNNNFYMIGHSANDLALTSSGMPASSPVNLARLARTWKAQITGGLAGTIDMSFDASGVIPTAAIGNIRLLIDADGDGNFTNGTLPPITPTSISGTVLSFNALSIPAGATFTFTTLQAIKSPGGSFGGLTLWMDAKNGLTNSGGNLGGWNDQAGINTFTQGTGQYVTNAVNFNPAARFNNTAGQNLIGNTTITMTEFYAVAAWTGTDLSVSRGHVLGALNREPLGNERNVFISTSSAMAMQLNDYGSTSALFATGAAPLSGIFNVWTANGANNIIRRDASGLATTGGPGAPSITDVPRIAGRPDATRVQMNGQIAEVIAYNTNKAGAGRDNIESYLAVKYGIHKTGNYINSANTVIWDATLNAAYHHDVFGIGRDDTTGLMQVQSNSMNTGSGNGIGQSGLGNIVLSNPSALANLSYLMVGHDLNNFTLINSNMPAVIPPSYGRFSRSWKEETTGTVGTVSLSFDVTGIASLAGVRLGSARLIIDHDADGNFATGTSTVIPVSSITGNVLTFNNVSFSPAVFSLAFELPRLTVSGNVWDDANGDAIMNGTETFTNAGNLLFANLIDKVADTLLASIPVAANGSYSLTSAVPQNTANTYAVIITTTATSAIPGIPGGYAFTGQDSANVIIPSPSGILSINTLAANFTGLNFGVDQLPVTDEKAFTNVPNSAFADKTQPGYLGIPMTDANLAPLSGNDPEDCPAIGSCNLGKTFQINTINANTLLYYNGTLLSAPTTIANFDASLFVIYGALGSGTGANPVGFTYSLSDAAGKPSAVAATYSILSAVPLPIDLVSFSARQNNCNNVLVNWTVANAKDFRNFEVQRSSDKVNFITVGTLSYNQQQMEYSFKDAGLSDGDYLYRLKLVDVDASFKLSQIVKLTVNCNAANNVSVLPNPAHSYITVKGIKDRADVRVVNMHGQLLINAMNVGELQQIDITKLPSAMYVVQVIKNGSIIATTKIVKEN